MYTRDLFISADLEKIHSNLSMNKAAHFVIKLIKIESEMKGCMDFECQRMPKNANEFSMEVF